MPVRGIERVRRNYKVTMQEITGRRTETAIYAILSQGAAMADTMTPIDTGTLINSRYAPQIEHNGKRTTGRVGYTAAYAARVHEASGKLAGMPRADGSGNYWDPNAEPRFMYLGFEMIQPGIPALLRGIYRV